MDIWKGCYKHILICFKFPQIAGATITPFPIYTEASMKFAILSRNVEFSLLKVIVPLFVAPTIVNSYIKYYIYNASESSFRLAFPMS